MMGLLKDFFDDSQPPASEGNIELRTWEEEHTGDFRDADHAYTIFVDGKQTNISFSLEAQKDFGTHYCLEMEIPSLVAYYSVKTTDEQDGSFEAREESRENQRKEQVEA